jgi:hypothetical protein
MNRLADFHEIWYGGNTIQRNFDAVILIQSLQSRGVIGINVLQYHFASRDILKTDDVEGGKEFIAVAQYFSDCRQSRTTS